MISQKKISCQTKSLGFDHGNRLSFDRNIELDECKMICDGKSECMFFLFSHHDSSCHTFKTCDKPKQEATKTFGTIYANNKGNKFNSILYVVLTIWIKLYIYYFADYFFYIRHKFQFQNIHVRRDFV